jgi:DUF1365 family protein
MLYSHGPIWHRRNSPVKHEFSYRTLYWILDVDQFDNKIRQGLFTLDPVDYLLKEPISLREKFQKLLKENGIDDRPDKVYLHTVPRFLGRAFNPVSFYIGESKGHNIFLMEINNTFGEKHSYACRWEDPSQALQVKVDKVFHVSPFNPLDDTYQVSVQPRSDRYAVQVDIERDGEVFFESNIVFIPEEWKTTQGFQMWFGLGVLLTTARILYHAAILYFKKGLKTFDLPNPSHPKTIRWGKPVLLQRLLTGEWLEKLNK